MKTIGKIRKAAVIASLLIVLAGCGVKSKDISSLAGYEDAVDTGFSFSYEIIDLPDDFDEAREKWAFSFDKSAYVKEAFPSQLVLTSLVSGEKEILFECKENQSIVAVDMDANSRVLFVVKSYGNHEKEDLYLLDSDLEVIFSKDISDLFNGGINSVCINCDSVLVSSPEKIVKFNTKGESLGQYRLKGNERYSRCLVNDKYIVIYGENGNETQYRLLEKESFLEKESHSTDKKKIWAGGKNALFYYTGDGLFETGFCEERDKFVFSFSEIYIDYSTVKFFSDCAENRFIFLISEEGKQKVLRVFPQKEEETKKGDNEKICLNMLCANKSMFQGLVNNYNKVSDSSMVNLLPEVSLDRYDYELLSSDYDLFEIPGSSKYESYVANGYLCAIDDYIGKSNVLKEDYLQRVYDDFSIDGKIYGLPRQMYLIDLWIPEDVIGEIGRWDVYEYLDFLKEHPNAISGKDSSVVDNKSSILYFALIGITEELIEGKEKFDIDVLSDIIKRINELDISEVYLSKEERLKNGEVLLLKEEIDSADELADYQSKTSRKWYPIGFPTLGMKEAGGIMDYFNIIGISASSKKPEAAWKFLEYRLSQKASTDSTSVPTRREEFEERMLYSKFPEEIILDGVKYGPVTEAETKKMIEAYEKARYYTDLQRDIVLLIGEEASFYFSDQKSLEDVLDIIESRINVMLEEKGDNQSS